jgi:hypothetical protein
VIRREAMSPHFTKFHLNSRGEEPWPCRPVLHLFDSPDDGVFHDHPFGMWVMVLAGGYEELVLCPGTVRTRSVTRRVGDAFRVEADHVHRIVALPLGPCMTVALYDVDPPPKETSYFEVVTGELPGEYRVRTCPAEGPDRWKWRDL